MSEPKVVWVVLYSHKHGTDTLVCETEKAAYHNVIDIMLEWIDEFDDPEQQRLLIELLQKEEYGQAINLWAEVKGDEYFEVDRMLVLPELGDTIERLEEKLQELSE
jgi:hypothetical protein